MRTSIYRGESQGYRLQVEGMSEAAIVTLAIVSSNGHAWQVYSTADGTLFRDYETGDYTAELTAEECRKMPAGCYRIEGKVDSESGTTIMQLHEFEIINNKIYNVWQRI